ncbi:hypothetical protein DSECCO2_326810 [anaerobic digester metagenome]
MFKKNVQIANFNCTFGEDYEPMFPNFASYVYPAFDSGITRTRNSTIYSFMNVELLEIDSRPLFCGIILMEKEIQNRTKPTEDHTGIEPDNKIYALSPISYWGIFLDNHRMYYIKNQSESPDLQSFRVTANYMLNEYKKTDRSLPKAHLDINQIPSESDEFYDKLFSDVILIKKLQFNIVPKNPGELDEASLESIISNTKIDVSAETARAEFNNVSNIKNTKKLVKNSKGFTEINMKVKKQDGSNQSWKNQNFSESIPISINNQEGQMPSNTQIAKNLVNNNTLKDSSSIDKKIFDKYKEKFFKHFRQVIKIINRE